MYGFLDCYYNGVLKFSRYYPNIETRKRYIESEVNSVGVCNHSKLTFIAKPYLSLRQFKREKL